MTHAVTPVPHEVTTGLSKEMPAEEFGIRILILQNQVEPRLPMVNLPLCLHKAYAWHNCN
jgi:hypothetical protein